MPTLREPCSVGIVFAVAIEADAFERLATGRLETRAAELVFHEGTVRAARVAWCVGGVGTAAARRATERLLAGHRPAMVVSAGFAGGLDPSLARGTVVRPALAVTDGGLRPIPLATPRHAAASPGTIVTVADVVATPDAKRSLAERSGGQLVDMETHAVAEVAAAAGLPCAVVRVVSDDAAAELPREVTALVRPQSAMRRLGTALGAVGRRPGAALDLWRLYERAVVDGRTLAAALADLCAEAAGR